MITCAKRAVAGLIFAFVASSSSADMEVFLTTHHVSLGAHHAKLVVLYDDPAECLECDLPTRTDACMKAGEASTCPKREPLKVVDHAGCKMQCGTSGFVDSFLGRLSCKATNRTYCTVIGAGADGWFNGKLLGALNRPTGVGDTASSVPKRLIEGVSAKQLLPVLVKRLEVHQKQWHACADGGESGRMDYDLVPDIQDGHNSNSFIKGLFFDIEEPVVTKPDITVPGWEDPVPSGRFVNPECPDE